MENQDDIVKEILELREEMNYLIEEQKILDAFFKKGIFLKNLFFLDKKE